MSSAREHSGAGDVPAMVQSATNRYRIDWHFNVPGFLKPEIEHETARGAIRD